MDNMTSLPSLQLDRTSSCYRLGPGASERMALRAPGHMLCTIDHIEINRYVQRHSVVYYVLEIFLKHQRRKSWRPLTTHVVGMPIELIRNAPDNSDDIYIDVELNSQPDMVLERRFSEFEALRTQLSVNFETLHPDDCVYCDPFIEFLACSSIQPGFLTKLTTRAPQRKGILSAFINQTIRLAVHRVEGELDGVPAHCDGWTIIPQIVENFLREPPFKPAT